MQAPQLSAAGTVVIRAAVSEPPPTLAPSARTGVPVVGSLAHLSRTGTRSESSRPRRMSSTRSASIETGIRFWVAGTRHLYRIDSPSRYTSLLSLASNQITALETTKDGAILACTGNVGKVYQFGPEMEKSRLDRKRCFRRRRLCLLGPYRRERRS